MVGNEQDALKALTHDFLPNLNPLLAWRRVHLINGVIYKVNKADYINESEWENYLNIINEALPPFLAVPRMWAYKFGRKMVIAAEYIDAPTLGDLIMDLPHEVYAAISRYIDDIHEENIIVKDGVYYLIDLDN